MPVVIESHRRCGQDHPLGCRYSDAVVQKAFDLQADGLGYYLVAKALSVQLQRRVSESTVASWLRCDRRNIVHGTVPLSQFKRIQAQIKYGRYWKNV